MRTKMIWGLAILIIGLIGVTVVMLTRTTDTENEPIVNKYIDRKPINKIEKTGKRDIVPVEADGTIDTSKPQTEYATEIDVEGMYVTAIPRDPDRFAHLPKPPLPPSSVPEDCPEHLKLLPEWIDGVYRGIEPNPSNDQWTADASRKSQAIFEEIIREHNPNRPYAEIWDQFIEYEKMYRAYGEYELGYTPNAEVPGANRLDWFYEQTWAFPELIALGMPTAPSPPPGETHYLLTARKVGMGYLTPDWNKITLKDGRDFFIKGKTRYEFVYSGFTEGGEPLENVTGFSRTRVTESTPVVRIDVLNTSDEELEALMGWDYRINPLTMQPLPHEGYYEPVYPRIATGE